MVRSQKPLPFYHGRADLVSKQEISKRSDSARDVPVHNEKKKTYKILNKVNNTIKSVSLQKLTTLKTKPTMKAKTLKRRQRLIL